MGTETEIFKGVFALFALIGIAICLLAFMAVILAMVLYLQCKLEDVARKWRENKASIKQWWSFRHWQYKVHDVTCTHTAAKAVIEELEKSDNVYQLDLDVEALETAIQAFKKRAGYPEPVELPSMPCERGIADSVIVCLDSLEVVDDEEAENKEPIPNSIGELRSFLKCSDDDEPVLFQMFDQTGRIFQLAFKGASSTAGGRATIIHLLFRNETHKGLPSEKGIADAVTGFCHDNAPNKPTRNQMILHIQQKYDLDDTYKEAIAKAISEFLSKAKND